MDSESISSSSLPKAATSGAFGPLDDGKWDDAAYGMTGLLPSPEKRTFPKWNVDNLSSGTTLMVRFFSHTQQIMKRLILNIHNLLLKIQPLLELRVQLDLI